MLVKVDEMYVAEMSYKDVVEHIRNTSDRARKLVFQESNVYYRAKRLRLVQPLDASRGASKQVAAAIVDTRIVREDGKAKFCEYEVSVAAPKLEKLGEAIRRWSTWKRYSEFLALDASLRKRYGWQMEAIRFPAKRTFNNLDPEFIQKRREELDTYLSEVSGGSVVGR